LLAATCVGDEALFKAASGPLDVMGKAKFFLGEEGKGANMKLVVNAVMGAMMASFAEGMSLADQVIADSRAGGSSGAAATAERASAGGAGERRWLIDQKLSVNVECSARQAAAAVLARLLFVHVDQLGSSG
jgi:6-phosphogluconate dehydrogenase (decarboxylating)